MRLLISPPSLLLPPSLGIVEEEEEEGRSFSISPLLMRRWKREKAEYESPSFLRLSRHPTEKEAPPPPPPVSF